LKRLNIITVVIAVLLVPALLFAADRFAPAEATIGADNTIIVPLEIANQEDLMAMDIPLSFSEGVTLKRVDFEDTRVSYFDLKIAKIDNDENIVVIGLVAQASPEAKENLAAGRGTVANLVFEVNDPTVDVITLEAIKRENPHHSLTFIYSHRDDQSVQFVRSVPDFGSATVALSNTTSSDNLPTTFGLEQNYPNPFNPTTQIEFSLPVPSRVDLTVFNVLGQEVRSVINDEMPAGHHSVTWDGNSSSGNSVSSGVYFYRLEAGDFVETRKMMLLK